MNKNTAIVVLAAGNSSRMGQCKFLLPCVNGKTFLENIVDQLIPLQLGQIVIVTQQKFIPNILTLFSKGLPKNIQIVQNENPEYERFYSLQLGIKELRKINYCFIHNADNPFVAPDILRKLFLNNKNADWIKPKFGIKGGHPILINRKVLNHILACDKDSFLNEELRNFTVCEVSVDNDSVLTDIDNRYDYQNYLQHELLRA